MQIRTGQMAVLLLIFLAMSGPAVAQDIDAKIKRLEDLEARIDAKIKKLEEMEATLDVRLQRASAPAPGVQRAIADGTDGMPAAGSALVAGAVAAHAGNERESIHQVMFRGGFTHLNRPAESAGGALGGFTGPKNDTDGWNVGAVIGVKLLRDPFFDNPVMGEVSLDFSRISGNTRPLSGLQKSGNQSLFKVSVAPKYRFDNLGDLSPALSRIRPWITPIGLSFLVNSPPSASVNYLTVGGTTGAGVEYLLHDRLSVGLGLTYNFYDKTANRISTNHLTVGPYVGINH